MKRLFVFMFLSVLLYNWIGYQLYTAIADQAIITKTEPSGLPDSKPASVKIPSFHIALYEKELDFDDLLEFTASADHPANEIYFHIPADLFPDYANKENRNITFKCFNGEYYPTPDRLFNMYPGADSFSKIPDRYLLKIPLVFLSPQEYPPQVG